jgi:hypothetical protein
MERHIYQPVIEMEYTTGVTSNLPKRVQRSLEKMLSTFLAVFDVIT